MFYQFLVYITACLCVNLFFKVAVSKKKNKVAVSDRVYFVAKWWLDDSSVWIRKRYFLQIYTAPGSGCMVWKPAQAAYKRNSHWYVPIFLEQHMVYSLFLMYSFLSTLQQKQVHIYTLKTDILKMKKKKTCLRILRIFYV